MILKTIPRNIKAGVALVVLLIFFGMGLDAFSLVLTSQATAWDVLRCMGGIIIGTIAAIAFYIFQSESHNNQNLEIVAQYHKDVETDKRLKTASISIPKFPGDEEKPTVTDKNK